MSFLKKLFGGGKSLREEGIASSGPKAIPVTELELDADAAEALIAGAGIGETAIGLSTDKKRVFFVMKQSLSPGDISSLRKAIEQGRVQLGHRLFEMPNYPVFVVKATIQDDPRNPFWMETFPNIAGEDRVILQRLFRGGRLGTCFHFYGPDERLLFRAGYESLFRARTRLGDDIVKAEMYLESLPSSNRNYRAAVQQVIRENP